MHYLISTSLSQMTDTNRPTQLLLWIYEDYERVNLEDCPFGSGDIDALEVGIHQYVEHSLPWKTRHSFSFDIEMVLDITEEGAGILKCFDPITGEPKPFPQEWLEKNLKKFHVLNNPEKMEPLLRIYSNPWKYQVEMFLTTMEDPVPPQRSLMKAEVDASNMKEQKLIQEAVSSLQNLLGESTMKKNQESIYEILADLVRDAKKLN